MHELRLPGGRRDALFIWNCFEQVPDPTALLAEAHRVLKRHGLLVVQERPLELDLRLESPWIELIARLAAAA